MKYNVYEVWGSTTRFDGVDTAYGYPARYAVWGGGLFSEFGSHNRALVERICASLNGFSDELEQEKTRANAENVATEPKTETNPRQARGSR